MALLSNSYTNCQLGFALTAVWVANAIPRPPAKRSAAIGIVNGIGNMGNLYVSRHDFLCFSDMTHYSLVLVLARIRGSPSGGPTITLPCISGLRACPSVRSLRSVS